MISRSNDKLLVADPHPHLVKCKLKTMKNFRPHKSTLKEDYKALDIGNLYNQFCNDNRCVTCKFCNSTADCKILFTLQYMQKEQEQCNK